MPQAGLVDLDRLNQAEREILLFLAGGHTAKSIATLTGRSVGAVNERLREARRKTGVSSSRELARLLKTQKNWDEEMGMATIQEAGASEPTGAPSPHADGRSRKGPVLMLFLGIAVVIAGGLSLQEEPEAAQQAQASPSPDQITPASANDLLLKEMFSEPATHEPRYLYGLVRTERRDPAWATARRLCCGYIMNRSPVQDS